MPPDGWRHGSPIHRTKGPDGVDVATELRYLSPSAITLADPESEGCLRKWAWQYIAGKKQPETPSQAIGTALHADVERYLKTGQKNLSALALAGLHMVPTPDLELIARGENDLGVELEMSSQFSDPEHQFAVDEAWAMRQAGDYSGASRMLNSIGVVTASGVPVIGRIDLIHARGTNQGTDNPDEAIDPPNTVEVYDWKTSKDVARYGKTAAQLGRNVQMLAYANWVLLVSPETEHVRVSHGYFQTQGSRKTRKVTTRLTRGEVVRRWEYADNLARRIVHAARELDPNKVEANLGACEKFGGCPHRSYCDAGMERGLKGFFPASQLKAKGTKKMGFLDTLRKTDQERKATLTGPKADPRFADAWKAITSLGEGRPCLSRDLSEQLALHLGEAFTENHTAGTGAMGKATIKTMDELLEIAAECAAEMPGSETAEPAKVEPKVEPKPEPGKVTPLSPDAPASDPAIASAGVDGKDPTKKTSKAKAKTAPPAAAVETVEPPKEVDVTKTRDLTRDVGDVTIYVDCIPFGSSSPGFTTLNGWVQTIADEISRGAGCDFRYSQEKPYSFGGWKGLVADLVRDTTEHPLPSGSAFFLDARGSEIMEVAAEALLARPGVGIVIRGQR